MFTAIFAVIGMFVFLASLLVTKFDFSTSLKRLAGCVIAGLLIDFSIGFLFAVLASISLT